MKKLHVLAVGAFIAPAITFGMGSALAQSPSQTPSADHGTYLSSQPANAFRADELIGSDLKSRMDGEDTTAWTDRDDKDSIGTVSDLLIDEDGQIVAVIVDVGGFLGMGAKEVAIPWDSIEHGRKDDGDDYYFSVSATEDALKEAPEYKQEDNRSQY